MAGLQVNVVQPEASALQQLPALGVQQPPFTEQQLPAHAAGAAASAKPATSIITAIIRESVFMYCLLVARIV
jgi:hypothetical protein